MSTENSPLPLTDDRAAETAVPATEPPAESPGERSTAGGPGEERNAAAGGAAAVERGDESS